LNGTPSEKWGIASKYFKDVLSGETLRSLAKRDNIDPEAIKEYISPILRHWFTKLKEPHTLMNLDYDIFEIGLKIKYGDDKIFARIAELADISENDVLQGFEYIIQEYEKFEESGKKWSRQRIIPKLSSKDTERLFVKSLPVLWSIILLTFPILFIVTAIYFILYIIEGLSRSKLVSGIAFLYLIYCICEKLENACLIPSGADNVVGLIFVFIGLPAICLMTKKNEKRPSILGQILILFELYSILVSSFCFLVNFLLSLFHFHTLTFFDSFTQEMFFLVYLVLALIHYIVARLIEKKHDHIEREQKQEDIRSLTSLVITDEVELKKKIAESKTRKNNAVKVMLNKWEKQDRKRYSRSHRSRIKKYEVRKKVDA
jgi:hypothetical protein